MTARCRAEPVEVRSEAQLDRLGAALPHHDNRLYPKPRIRQARSSLARSRIDEVTTTPDSLGFERVIGFQRRSAWMCCPRRARAQRPGPYFAEQMRLLFTRTLVAFYALATCARRSCRRRQPAYSDDDSLDRLRAIAPDKSVQGICRAGDHAQWSFVPTTSHGLIPASSSRSRFATRSPPRAQGTKGPGTSGVREGLPLRRDRWDEYCGGRSLLLPGGNAVVRYEPIIPTCATRTSANHGADPADGRGRALTRRRARA